MLADTYTRTYAEEFNETIQDIELVLLTNAFSSIWRKLAFQFRINDVKYVESSSRN